MTDGEIYTNYRQAKDRRAQIRIIADLNVVPVNAVICKLLDMGFTDKWLHKYHRGYFAPWSDEEIRKLLRLKDEGWKWREISMIMGRTPQACQHKEREVRMNENI